MSVNPTPVNALEVLGFANVNVSVLALPCAIVVGENAFERVGSDGRGQPVIVILSRPNEAFGLLEGAPMALILNVVVLVPVVVAV